MNASGNDIMTLRLIDLHENCTDFAVYCLGYIIPGLAVCVVLINIPIVIVFTRQHVRSHTTFILALIACTDTVNIVCPTIPFVYHYTTGHYGEFLGYSQCRWTYILGDVCVDMFNMISLWLTVLLAYIRCRCLKSPFSVRHIHSAKRILVYIGIILMLTGLVHVPSVFFFEFVPVKAINSINNSTQELCGIVATKGILLTSFLWSGRKLQVLIKTIFESIIPVCILVYCNIVMILALEEAKQGRSSLRRNDSTSRNNYHTGTCGVGIELAKCERIESDNNIEGVVYENTRGHSSISIGETTTDRCKYRYMNISMCSRSCCVPPGSFRKKVNVCDSGFAKLDRDSKRVSRFIVLVSTIIVVHEIPMAVANVHTLVSHADVPLLINIYGCFYLILLLWQYITYPVIFLIYTCMSGAFRSEFWKAILFTCKQHEVIATNTRHKLFLSPCSVRKRISLDAHTADPAQDSLDAHTAAPVHDSLDAHTTAPVQDSLDAHTVDPAQDSE